MFYEFYRTAICPQVAARRSRSVGRSVILRSGPVIAVGDGSPKPRDIIDDAHRFPPIVRGREPASNLLPLGNSGVLLPPQPVRSARLAGRPAPLTLPKRSFRGNMNCSRWWRRRHPTSQPFVLPTGRPDERSAMAMIEFFYRALDVGLLTSQQLTSAVFRPRRQRSFLLG